MDGRLAVEGVAEGSRVRSNRGSGGAGASDGNPWIGGKGECEDGAQYLVVGGGALQRVPRATAVTSAR